MVEEAFAGPEPNSVEITENLGEWFVRVVRDGRAQVRSFEREVSANAFAEGQRLGLGLERIKIAG